MIPTPPLARSTPKWVQLREDSTATGQDLAAACRGRIATYKIPRYWRIVDSFPMTVTGKIQKYRMREIAIEELGLSPQAQRAAA